MNDKCELIGISTSTIQEGQNLNFAIPINEVLDVEIGSYKKDEKFRNFELFDKGMDAWKKGNYNIAVEYYTKYIEIYPTSFQAFYNRALVKEELDDYSGAMNDYSKAIELNPNDTHSYFARGILKGTTGDDIGAIKDFSKSIEIDPNNPRAYYGRGIAKYNIGDENGACSDWSKAGELGYYDAYEEIRENCN